MSEESGLFVFLMVLVVPLAISLTPVLAAAALIGALVMVVVLLLNHHGKPSS